MAAQTGRFPYQALWRTAVFGWASFGLYYVYWAWRVGHARRSMGHAGVSPRLHALAFLFVPAGAFLLARLGGLARRSRGGSRSARWFFVGVAFFVLGIASGRAELTLPFLVALPLPVLLVQREMNAGWGAERPASRLRWRDALALVSCLAAFALLWQADGSALAAWLSPTAEANARVVGPQRDYWLVPVGPGWAVVPPGTNGDPDSDFELQSRFRPAWVVVYRLEKPTTGLDDAVDVRFQNLEEASHVVAFDEQRSLDSIDEHGFVTTSRARFSTEDLFGRETFHARVIRTQDRMYEVIGWADSSAYDGAVAAIVDSFELTRAGVEP